MANINPSMLLFFATFLFLCGEKVPLDGRSVSTGLQSRLIVVSNRLPITITAHESDAISKGDGYSFKKSSGGLVTGLSGCQRDMPFKWIGWSGLAVPEFDRPSVQAQLASDYSCKAVWLDNDLADRHYNGFSNSVLWPVFHHQPQKMNFDQKNWKAYQQANLAFEESVHEEIEESVSKGEDVLVWVQDYHLMLLPMLLRRRIDRASEAGLLRDGAQKRGKVSIGFFLHTPFPPSEIFRTLPGQHELLSGLLHSDLVGFHTPDYARHFFESCHDVLDIPVGPNGIIFNQHYVNVGSFPIGIDFQKFHDQLLTSSVQKRVERLRKDFEGMKVVIGVDRLDFMKGIPHKLRAFDIFLSKYPEWAGKVVLFQIAMPSRQDMAEYHVLKDGVDKLVDQINRRHGAPGYEPILLYHTTIPLEELCALYAIGDACLVTSTRDGMNLVSLEYVACQQKTNGVLILSEFAGAARSLKGAIAVNPWEYGKVSDAINMAMTMTKSRRKQNFEEMFSYVSKFTAAHWGHNFVAEMQRTLKEKS